MLFMFVCEKQLKQVNSVAVNLPSKAIFDWLKETCRVTDVKPFRASMHFFSQSKAEMKSTVVMLWKEHNFPLL